MALIRTVRLELHSGGQAQVLEESSNRALMVAMMARHFETLRATDTVGSLLLVNAASGRILARKRLTGGLPTGKRRTVTSP